MVKICWKYTWRLHYWPILTGFWFIFSILITYLISVFISKNNYWFFPNISDTGVFQPESSYFTFLLHIGVILMVICMYMRYKQIECAINNGFHFKHKWNTLAVVFGYLSCFGLEIAASFQANIKYSRFIHSFGAAAGFSFGPVYFIFQTWITYRFRKFTKTPKKFQIGSAIFIYRIIASSVTLPLFFSYVFIGYTAWSQFDGENYYYWNENDKAHNLRVCASISEWVMCFIVFSYVLTFIKDFKSIEFDGPIFKMKYEYILFVQPV